MTGCNDNTYREGERATGDETFWGFVWPGAADECLTCLALEWQASEGGGRIIEANRTVSVNNVNAIRAWERAAHWIGWISPPNVTAYQELDSVNHFENSGKAAFSLGWISDYFITNLAKTMIYVREGGRRNVKAGLALEYQEGRSTNEKLSR